jgi:hypothetical protein
MDHIVGVNDMIRKGINHFGEVTDMVGIGSNKKYTDL